MLGWNIGGLKHPSCGTDRMNMVETASLNVTAKALGCLTCPQDLGGMENLAGSRTESCPGKVAGVIFSHAGLIDST